MPLKTIVKVSHISNLSDARYCSGMGVDMLGFRAVPGAAHYLPPEIYQDIRGWIAGPAVVAELYGISNASQIEKIAQTYAPDLFELTYDAYLEYGMLINLPCIVYLPNPDDVVTAQPHAPIRYLLVDENIPEQQIASAGYPVLKKVTSPAVLETVLAAGHIKGIALAGPEEVRPGVTNYDALGTILEALEDD